MQRYCVRTVSYKSSLLCIILKKCINLDMGNVLGEFFGQNGIIALKSEGHSIFPGVKSENFLRTACISDLLGINSCCLLMCLACSLQV